RQALRRFTLIEDFIQLAFTNGIQHQAVLVTQDLLFLLIAKTAAGCFIRIRSCPLSHTAPADEHLGLQEQLVLSRLALHVVHGVVMLDIGIEAKDHVMAFRRCISRSMFPLKGKPIGLTLPYANSNLDCLSSVWREL